eukprot:CAMPEP_0202858162 /NCGR_PEP_ID=MMETSP1391-20130828/812_1 /ASSEMBLY_ACC=CAM_ASM_000867 /TAXON_ID=1034604 /ORGANISM="Chlamydomonas leiostraca, Strain SAG 11-49" /LENGTH=288 /DNA_ID=CAMNT_0049537049 /DNA_START=25 /DNA_END=891 /DNA_ORIENTATION=-
MGDPLFSVRNAFYLGAYNTVINEASDMETLSDADAIERDCFVYRSYIALGSYELAISEIKDSAATGLQAVKLLAQYLSGKKSKDSVINTFTEWLGDSACNRNPTVLLMAGIVHMHEGNYAEALKICHVGLNLEMHALCVQLYIKMDRVDKAEQALKAMTSTDDDATITQLATAWLGLALGGAKVQEASYIFQELGEKYNWTPALYNGRAAAHMKMGEWEDAERDLLDAFNKDAKDADTLANLITCGLHLSKNTARYVSQLKIIAPNHPVVKRLAAGDEMFDRAAASMA